MYNGTSGAGSYGEVGDFKADIIKNLIDKYDIKSTLEYGCGDGNQIGLIDYDNYIGFDVAEYAVKICESKFKDDPRKKFSVYDPRTFNFTKYNADMVVCLDVLYHITDDNDFNATLDAIFFTSNKLVVLFTKLTRGYEEFPDCPTIVDRDIYAHIAKYKNFKLVDTIRHNLYSAAHFLILEKIQSN